MSIQAVSWVLQHSKAKLGARLALIAIANHADAAGNNSFPSIPTIAAEAHLSERQTQRAIRTLERQGELRIVEGKGRNGTHLFMIAGMGDNMSPDNLSPGVTNRADRGDKSGEEQAQNVTQTVKRTVLEEESSLRSAERDPVAEIWARGVAILGDKRRPLLGKAIKTHGQIAVLEAIVATETEMPVEPAAFFLGCLARAGPVNGHKLSPMSKFWQGAYDAAEAYNRRHGITDDRGADHSLDVPLLDGG